MKRFYRFVSTGIIAAMLQSPFCANALKIEQQSSDGKFEISGTAQENSKVFLQIVPKDGTDWNSLSLMNADSKKIKFADQTTSGANGNYTFSVNVSGASDNYIAYVYGNGERLESGEFVFSDVDAFKKIISDMTLLAQSEAGEEEKIAQIKELLTKNTKNLGISFGIYDCLDEGGVLKYTKMLYTNLLKNGVGSELAESDFDKAVTTLRRYLAIAALNSKSVRNIFEFKEELGFKTIDDTLWYENPVVAESMQKNITARLSGKNIETEKEFETRFKEALILSVIEEPDGWGNVKKIMEDNAEFLNIDISKGTQGRYSSLVKKSFEDKEKLKSAYDSYKDDSSTETGGGSKGGSKSGGKGGISIGSNIGTVKPVTPISTADSTKQPVSFTDIDGVEWAKDAIKELAEKDIISGADSEHFLPYSDIKREELVKIIAGVFALDAGGSVPFEDVKDDDWFYAPVSAAYNSGVVSGISKNLFGSNTPVTRQDMCVMIYNALSAKNISLAKMYTQKTFADNGDISPYAAEAVAVLQTAGIVSGNEKGEFKPFGNATRAEAAVMLYRIFKLTALTENN